MPFVILGTTATALHAAADSAASKLPLIGTQNPAAEIYLCHFSDNQNIQNFTADAAICNWLNGFSVSAKKVAHITNINNIRAVNSLYVVRVGVNVSMPQDASEIFPLCKSKFGVYEFSLALDVPSTHFARISISYDQNTDCFV